MAKVYLARDLRHNRQVALKVLRPDLGAVLGADRFQAEIQVTANLQHPNLLPLFDSGAIGGDPDASEASGGPAFLYYVMPFVEGESLRARLDREKQLPVDEAIRISTAIAAALDYAHRKGVVHRDLKPENILLHEGQPLVADFGIALAISNAGGARITQTGLSLGTPQYMSPEQATGDRAIDGRTDIYSLGALTYEMLAGEPPHTGGTSQAIIARVLTETPRAIRTTRPNVPEYVEAAVAHALEKIPADRFATANEFALALQGKSDRIQRSTSAVASRTSARRPAAREQAAWALAIAGIGAAAWFASRPEPAAAPGRFLVELPESVQVDPSYRLALSRSGTNLVLVAANGRSTQLYIRHSNDVAVTPIRGTDSARAPSFSPRGDWIVFAAGRTLKRVPASGGVAQVLASADLPILGTVWSDADQIFYRTPNSLWRASANGGAAKRLAVPDTAHGIKAINSIDILPGDKYAIAGFGTGGSADRTDSTQLGLINLADGTQSKLEIEGRNPHFVEPGFVLFTRSSVLFAVPFSARARKVTGVPVRLIEVAPGADVAVSETGWLAVTSDEVREPTTLWRVNTKGTATQLKIDAQPFIDLRISPDGQRVVMHATPRRFDEGNLWIYDLKSGSLTALTTKGSSIRPVWSRDGQRVYYMGRAGPLVSLLQSRPWDGSGAESTHLKAPSIAEVSLGPAHGLSALRTFGLRDILLAPTESLGAMRPFIESPANEEGPEISPNGRWLAYHSDESRRREVYVRPIPGPGARVQVSVSGGSQPRWSADGKTLFYRGPRYIASATITESPQFAVVKRDSLFVDDYDRSPGPGWDVFPNGREFLMLKGRVQPRRIYVIVNWRQLVDQSSGMKTSP